MVGLRVRLIVDFVWARFIGVMKRVFVIEEKLGFLNGFVEIVVDDLVKTVGDVGWNLETFEI